MSRTNARLPILCLVLVAGGLAGCGSKKDPVDASTEFEPNKSVFAAIAKADRLILYEGLPHQGYEQGLLEQEKRTKPTVTLHGFPFYRDSLEVSAEDEATLKGVLGDERSFRSWMGEKKCGGFHPDYLAAWHVGDAVYRVLICFGCYEVKVFGPDHSLRCDFAGDADTKLKELLKRYRKNRPPSEVP